MMFRNDNHFVGSRILPGKVAGFFACIPFLALLWTFVQFIIPITIVIWIFVSFQDAGSVQQLLVNFGIAIKHIIIQIMEG